MPQTLAAVALAIGGFVGQAPAPSPGPLFTAPAQTIAMPANFDPHPPEPVRRVVPFNTMTTAAVSGVGSVRR